MVTLSGDTAHLSHVNTPDASMNEHATRRPGDLARILLGDDDAEIVRRWWAGEATDEELREVIGRQIARPMTDEERAEWRVREDQCATLITSRVPLDAACLMPVPCAKHGHLRTDTRDE